MKACRTSLDVVRKGDLLMVGDGIWEPPSLLLAVGDAYLLTGIGWEVETVDIHDGHRDIIDHDTVQILSRG